MKLAIYFSKVVEIDGHMGSVNIAQNDSKESTAAAWFFFISGAKLYHARHLTTVEPDVKERWEAEKSLYKKDSFNKNTKKLVCRH